MSRHRCLPSRGFLVVGAALAGGLLSACAHEPAPEGAVMNVKDEHSLSDPARVRVTHADIDWTLGFAARELSGTVRWTVAREDPAAPLILDTKALTIEAVATGSGGRLEPATFTLHDAHPVFGTPLVVPLRPGDTDVLVRYKTTAQGSALQWLEPSQTAGGVHPFLFSQCQAIQARTMIPCQDSPGVRVTYQARVTVDNGLQAVMAARQLGKDQTGSFRFEMPQPIPSYLIAIAAGDLAFQTLGPRTGVYAEPSVLARAAYEFADTEAMVTKAESLYGPYRWERYDLIVLPPSFPFGGMENPRLTFATPTVLAGDRSLVALVAHELAHSWSGNLVTNATWSDFWLNEGFTVYFERRILEALYGRARTEMEASLGKHELVEEMKDLKPGDTILHIDLGGRDPDDAFSNVPYEKGYLFLRLVEETFGRERFDPVLKAWFDGNAFTSRTTADFVRHLKTALLDGAPDRAGKLRLDAWLHEAGLPANAPSPASDAFEAAAKEAKGFLDASRSAESLSWPKWTTQERLHFLRSLPEKIEPASLALLDAAWKLTDSGNSEVLSQWLLMAVRARYAPADQALESFLVHIGRRKFLKPLYLELAKTAAGKARARAIYEKARPGYHAIARDAIDAVLK